MFPESDHSIPCAHLRPAEPGSPLAAEWETYRREVGRLVAEGLEGKYALIPGDKIIDVYDSWETARQAGLQKFLLKPHMVRPILAREPVLHGPRFYRSCQS
jgi:hypothetical protein